MIKNKYKDDYSRTLRVNGRGKVVEDVCYTGEYYIMPFGQEEKKKTNLANIGFTVLLLAIQVISGLINQNSSRTFWIVYPYMFLFLPLAYLAFGAAGYLSAPLRMQKAHYENGPARIRHSLLGAVSLGTVNVVLEMIYIILHHGDGGFLGELAYLLGHCLFLSVAFLYLRYYNRIYNGILVEKPE